jgi:hypothetical protein
MKYLIVLLLAVLISFSHCKSLDGKKGNYNFHGKGIIKKLEITTWQYGTHTIDIGDKFYALKSDNIDLNKYNDQVVSIWGNKIEGYPVDGGPEYIDVKRIDH